MVYFVLGVGGLALASQLLSAEMSLTSTRGLWFQTMILVMVSAFLLEPRYASGSTAVTNAVAVVVIVLSAEAPVMRGWWQLLLAIAVVSLLVNLAAHGLLSTDESAPGRHRRVALKKLATQLGGWRAVLLPTAALALASFNDPFGREWAVGAAASFYALLVAGIRPHELVRELLRRQRAAETYQVAGIYPPSGLLLTTARAPGIQSGTVFRLSTEGGSADALAVEATVAGGAAGWRLLVPHLRSLLPADSSGDRLEEVRAEFDAPIGPGLGRAKEELDAEDASCAGVLTAGSSVRELHFDVVELGGQLALGEVVWTASDRGRCYWQVTDVSVHKLSWAGDTRHSLKAVATQLGCWDAERLGFQEDQVAPRADELVYRSVSGEFVGEVDLKGKHRIGTLVRSDFPVAVDLARLGRQHGAILGTTGTGKTHLAFGLVTGLIAAGSRVLCVDLTGQYANRFPEAPVLHSSKEAIEFGSDDGEALAVLTPERTDPITVLNVAAKSLLDVCRKSGPLDPEGVARLVIVVDEAHNFMPESFVIDSFALKAKVQETAMVLMESRKFGLGFVLISQRTAMVTKSALSQCNTVFAFQAVDQTGLDYMEGLCGRLLARSLPTLAHRTTIAMGQAMASATPLMAYVEDAEVVVH